MLKPAGRTEGGGGGGKRDKKNKILRGQENEGKNRGESGQRIERKQSVFFLFPKERRREEERGGERRREEQRSRGGPMMEG